MAGFVAAAVVGGAVISAAASSRAAKSQAAAATEAAATQSDAAVRVAEIEAQAAREAAELQADAFRRAAAEQEAGIQRATGIETGAPQNVNQLYASILGRTPDAGGLSFWSQQFGPTIDPQEIETFKQAAQAEIAIREADPEGYARSLAEQGIRRVTPTQLPSIAGGFELQAQAAQQAAAQLAQAQLEAARLQREQAERAFGIQQELLGPFREAGVNALARIQTGLTPGGEFAQRFTADQFQADPGYAFRFAEGQKALERQAAARGGLISGAALRAATRFGQEMGSQEFQNAFNRFYAERQAQLNPLFDLYAGGLGSAGELSGAAGAMGGNIANYLGAGTLGAGEALSRGTLGAAAARSTGYLEQLQAQAQAERDLATTRASAYTGPAQFQAQGVLQAGRATAGGQQGSAAALSQGLLQAGQAQAAGRLGVANALTGAIGSGLGYYQQQQLLNRLYPASTPAMVYGGGI